MAHASKALSFSAQSLVHPEKNLSQGESQASHDGSCGSTGGVYLREVDLPSHFILAQFEIGHFPAIKDQRRCPEWTGRPADSESHAACLGSTSERSAVLLLSATCHEFVSE